MSSGSSVFSIIPPKRARMERFILVQTPISAHPPAAKYEISKGWVGGLNAGYQAGRVGLVYDAHTKAVSNPAKTDSEYNSTRKTLPQTAGDPVLPQRRASDVGPELHPRPADFLKFLVTVLQSV